MAKHRLCDNAMASSQVFLLLYRVQESVHPEQESEARSRMIIFQGEAEEDPARRIFQQHQGMERKKFLCLGRRLGVSKGAPREVGAPIVPRSWGTPMASSVEKKGFYSVPILLEFKSFRRTFSLPEPMTSGFAGEALPTDDGPTTPSNAGESYHSRDELSRGGPSRDSSLEISFKKLGEKVEKSKNGGSMAGSTLAKGVVIGKNQPREDLANSPNKKGKAIDGSKGKEVASAPEAKKKATRPGNMACSRATSSPKPREGTSTNLGAHARILPGCVEQGSRGRGIPPARQVYDELLAYGRNCHLMNFSCLISMSTWAMGALRGAISTQGSDVEYEDACRVLSDQSIYGNWHTCSCIDGINTGVEVPDTLSGGSVSVSGRLVVSMRRSSSPSDFPTLYFKGFAG
ncbi:hypothetical protein Acr_12g0003260 [Actinidia rufa]|uniref:Uncharacterized protein n=1 Tax=Actinidia rufa TaxID=165716 RepID=A0A7J0FGH6_9ERIC|nr:hypothetical protein Acr_12g0003260 [Actinidia rufa]